MDIKYLKKLNPNEALKEALVILIRNPNSIKDIEKEISKGFANLCIDEIEKRLQEIKHAL